MQTFISLKSQNFRNYFIGHSLSTLGTWIQQVTLAWIIYDLTHSAALLGIIGFCALIPQLIVSPIAGAWIDKLNKQKFLIIIQILLFIQTMTLGVFYHFDFFTSSILISMSLLLGILTAIDTPLRQSLISLMIEDKVLLPNALALNAMIFNSSRFIGPPIAGLLLSLIGAEMCFYINACSYLCLAVAVLRMRSVHSIKVQGQVGHVFIEGLKYMYQNILFRRMMCTVIVINLTASSYVTLLPVFARDIIAGNEKTLGILWGCAGIGSLLSSLLLASKKDFSHHNKIFIHNMALCSIGLMILALSKSMIILSLAMFLLGFGISTTNILTNIMIQNSTEESLRGRAISIYTSTRFGFDAVGGLIIGLLASIFFPPHLMWVYSLVLASYLMLFIWIKIPQH
ncbi:MULTISPECIES: MFS transporter [unclassified Acinetobacter]|uniref:MFS transporter n=1 Tax=unclassified Acinetobacter TaxID=196816 RepID=UPI002934C4B9|nr:MULTISPECIES: MFS transporter [unclassified Acinetobacter]WOE32222.1 MFS transporter [Acinetobacter sp. SAAs470]WOE37692.1 MFS transporter [Acinetobacter sp. SAAs474]